MYVCVLAKGHILPVSTLCFKKVVSLRWPMLHRIVGSTQTEVQQCHMRALWQTVARAHLITLDKEAVRQVRRDGRGAPCRGVPLPIRRGDLIGASKRQQQLLRRVGRRVQQRCYSRRPVGHVVSQRHVRAQVDLPYSNVRVSRCTGNQNKRTPPHGCEASNIKQTDRQVRGATLGFYTNRIASNYYAAYYPTSQSAGARANCCTPGIGTAAPGSVCPA